MERKIGQQTEERKYRLSYKSIAAGYVAAAERSVFGQVRSTRALGRRAAELERGAGHA
jgi:hypothetical protein